MMDYNLVQWCKQHQILKTKTKTRNIYWRRVSIQDGQA